ncbi:UNVERIFIED_CONTAM: hypothetical protein GTU68_019738 [Idotea baltica]|nr:hypothetical protein [Idotea baltica]
MFNSDDAEMDKAFKAARETFKYFWRELAWEQRRIVPGLGLACVKVAFSDGPDAETEVEHMWVSEVDFDGKTITGVLINQPNWLKSVKQGDPVQVKPSEIGDWMYSINDRVYGAYTVNLMRAQMAPAERNAHDSAWGLDFGDPDVIEVVPPSKPAKKVGFFGSLLGKKAEVIAEDPTSAVDHPMALNMLPSLAEFLSQNPGEANSPDDRGLTMLHSMVLAGSAPSVEMLLANGADRTATTNNGDTALDLATALGWQSVIDVLK